MRPIPKKLLHEMLNDTWYEHYCLCGVWGVNLHHHIIYQGRQLNEKWAIVPVCREHHVGKTGVHNCRITKQKITKIVNKRKEQLDRILLEN